MAYRSQYDLGTIKSFLKDVMTNAEIRKEALDKEKEEIISNNTYMLDDKMQEPQQWRQQEVENELKQNVRNVECTSSVHLNFGIRFGIFVGNDETMQSDWDRKDLLDNDDVSKLSKGVSSLSPATSMECEAVDPRASVAVEEGFPECL